MIKTHQTLLVVSLSFALAACGSSSSGGSSSSDMGTFGTSKYRTIQSSDKTATYKMTADESKGEFMKSIKVERNDDGTYVLVSSDNPDNKLSFIGNTEIDGTYTTIGILDLSDSKEAPLLVAVGENPTSTSYIDAQVETGANASYHGNFLIKNGEQLELQETFVTVDFGNKKLSSYIPRFGEIRADITGNTFKGSFDSAEMVPEGSVVRMMADNYKTYTEGGFYGEDAAELAGFAVKVTEGQPDSRAVFQATKQDLPEEPNWDFPLPEGSTFFPSREGSTFFPSREELNVPIQRGPKAPESSE